MQRLALVALATLMTGCFDGLNTVASYFGGNSKGSLVHAPPPTTFAVVKSEANGVVTAAFDPSEQRVQVIAASANGRLAGAQISLPPGSLSVATDIIVEEATPIAASVTQELGLDANDAKATGPALLIDATAKVDAIQPFTVSLAIPGEAGLLSLLQAPKRYGVVYRVHRYATNEVLSGLIPPNLVSLVGGKVSFSILYFGAYQLVELARDFEQLSEVKSTVPVVAKAAADASPIAVESVKPLVAARGATVTVQGRNLRRTMTLAMGKVNLRGVEVKSDAVATFVMPDEVPFGATKLYVEQDGVRTELPLFAQADKTGFPLITMEPAGVCAGVVYFDALGNQQTGTRNCTGGASIDPATLTGTFMPKATYDVNGDGVVDTASTAATAGVAQSAVVAQFAQGRTGTASFVGQAISLNGDGNYYVINGDGQVASISAAPTGTRINLKTTGYVRFVNTGNIRIHDEGEEQGALEAYPDDFFEMIAVPSGWAIIGHLKALPRLRATRSGNVTLTNSTWVPLTFNSESRDVLGEFDPTTGAIVAQRTSCVRLRVNLEVLHPYFSGTDCSYGHNPSIYLKVTAGGGQVEFQGYLASTADQICANGQRFVSFNRAFLLPAGVSVALQLRSNDMYMSQDTTLVAGQKTEVVLDRAAACGPLPTL